MLCTPAILKRALDHYQSYLPTASEHLRETREKWIPIVVIVGGYARYLSISFNGVCQTSAPSLGAHTTACRRRVR